MPKKFQSKSYFFIFTVLVGVGCGKKNSSDSSASSVDTTDQTEQAMSGAEDATSALNENGSGGVLAALDLKARVSAQLPGQLSAAAMLLADTQPTLTRACASSGANTAQVTLTYTGGGSTIATKGNWSVATTTSASGTEMRNWSAPSGAVANGVKCDASAKYAAIQWGQATVANGLALAVTTNKAQTRAVVGTNAKKGTTKTYEADSTEKGTRTITWGLPTATSASLTIPKTVYSSVTRGRTYLNTAGVATTFTATITEAQATALAITVVRLPTAPYTLQSQQINSGTMTSTKTGGSVTTMIYNNVKYDFTSANMCEPISGTITGTSSPEGGTPVTFTIMFGDTTVDSGVSITYAGGTAQDYPQFDSKDCDLARP